MRCKNCGSENDDNLYICQNCGSPLYDEDEDIQPEQEEYTPVQPERSAKANVANQKEQKKKQQTIAIIVVLAIILVAIIVGIIVAVASSNKTNDDTTISSETTTIVSTTENDTTRSTTQQTTTTTTQTTTTTTTTTSAKFTVHLSCNEGGEVEGDGSYARGDHVTVIARPDDGYDFDGWYQNGKKISSSTKYSFTVTENRDLQAIFTIVEQDGGDTIDNIDGESDY